MEKQYALLHAHDSAMQSRTSVVTYVDRNGSASVVDFGEGCKPIPVANTFLTPVKDVVIPPSHYDGFIAHPGTWATIDDPGLKVGEPILFVLRWPPVPHRRYLVATVTDCHRLEAGNPTDAEWLGVGLQGKFKSLNGWYLIRYEGWFDEQATADWGGEGPPSGWPRSRLDALGIPPDAT